MPFILRKIRNKNLYKVILKDTGQILSHGTTLENARKQIALIGMRDRKRGGGIHNIKINTKEMNQNSNDLLDIFDKLSLTKNYNIVGSYNVDGVYFPSDIDLNEKIRIKNENNISQILKKLKTLFLEIKNNNNIFFIDFKNGIDDRGESLHWTLDEILDTKKKYGKNKSKFFDDALLEGTVKLDIIYRLNYGDFIEISMIYMINSEKINIIQELKNDIDEYLHNGRQFKALKRCFSLYSIENKQMKLYTLIKLFNSDLGLINKVISEITIYIQLLELYPSDVPLEEIFFSIQNGIKYFLSCIFRIKIKNIIFRKLDMICTLNNVNKTINELEKVNEYFKKMLEEQTKVWIGFNKNIIKF